MQKKQSCSYRLIRVPHNSETDSCGTGRQEDLAHVLLSSVPGDHRLALLLSQLAGSQPIRDLLTMQLVDWHRLQADCFIQEERLRIFALLAGKPVSSVTRLFCHWLDFPFLTMVRLSCDTQPQHMVRGRKEYKVLTWFFLLMVLHAWYVLTIVQ